MKKIFIYGIIFMSATWIQSCEQQSVDPGNIATFVHTDRDISALDINEFTEVEKDAIKTILAKSLSQAVANAEIRSFLKQEVIKEFDGDYDILFNAIKHEKIGNLSFAQHLMVNLPALEERQHAARTSERYNHQAIEAFVKNLDIDTDKLPLLQISVPFYGEDWNANETIPVAAAKDNVVQNHTDGLDIVAYHTDGKRTILKSDKLPEFPVMVVGENERLTVIKRNSSKNARTASCPLAPMFTDENYDYFAGDEYLSQCDSPIPIYPLPELPTPKPSCARDSKGTYAYEQMRNIEFVSMDKLREAEGWISGKIELRAIAADYKTAQAGDDAFAMLFYEKRKEFKTCGIFKCRTDNYDPKRDILIWNQNDIGDRMKIRFYEDNKASGSEIEIKIPFKVKIKILGVETEVGPEITAKIKPKNKLLGDNYVYYCNSVSKKYNNSWLTFEIRPEGM